MARNNANRSRKLKLITNGQLTARGRKTLDWFEKRYTGPITLTRQQFDVAYAAILHAVEDYQGTIESCTPTDGEYDEKHLPVVEDAEAQIAKLNRLLLQLQGYMRPEDRSKRRIGGAA